MTMDQAAIFLSASFLVVLGCIVIALGLVIINNLLYKHWRPVTILSKESFSLFNGHHSNDPMHNLTQEEYEKLVEHLEKMRVSKTEIDKTSS